MNARLVKCAVLLLVLIFVSTMGSLCELTCGLAIAPGHHHPSVRDDGKMTQSMNMAVMSASEMQPIERLASSHVQVTSPSNCEAQCTLGHSWLTGQKSPDQPASAAQVDQPAVIFLTAPIISAATASPGYNLRQSTHQAPIVLRI